MGEWANEEEGQAVVLGGGPVLHEASQVVHHPVVDPALRVEANELAGAELVLRF